MAAATRQRRMPCAPLRLDGFLELSAAHGPRAFQITFRGSSQSLRVNVFATRYASERVSGIGLRIVIAL